MVQHGTMLRRRAHRRVTETDFGARGNVKDTGKRNSN